MVMTQKSGQRVTRLVVFCLVINLAMIAYVFYTDERARVQVVKNQRIGCERGKLDRADNAAFQRAYTAYITELIAAKSVKEDVRRAAREARHTYVRTSTALSARARINCAQAFPKASIFP